MIVLTVRFDDGRRERAALLTDLVLPDLVAQLPAIQPEPGEAEVRVEHDGRLIGHWQLGEGWVVPLERRDG